MRSEASLRSATSLRAYQGDLSSIVALDRETERQLARDWLAGDAAAGRRIIEACLPFVISIALEYRRWGVPLEDIIQQGNLGLLRAAKKFDLAKDCRLATYAAYWIRAEIREYVVRGFRVVRLGTTKGERRALRAYRTTGESDPEKLAAVSGLSVERTTMLLPVLAAREASLDASTADMGPAVERLASQEPSPEDASSANESRAQARKAVKAALRGLSDRERMIVEERMMAEDPTTLEQLVVTLGVSKERVRQIESRARGKLRASLGMLQQEPAMAP
jgi:RNA polymerase sigma-32 factor